MSAIDPSVTVAELVVEKPGRARLFEQLGIDYCCGGKRSLAEACAEQGLDARTVGAVLAALDAPPGEEHDWAREGLGALCDHIVEAHHTRLREELPRLSSLLEKVERAHGEGLPAIGETRAVFAELRGELETHMRDEEEALFPAVRALEAGASAVDPGLVAALEHEHDRAASLLRRLRELNGDYDLSAALCNTHRATLDGLHALERDLHEHIHEENNILFPRALEAAGGR